MRPSPGRNKLSSEAQCDAPNKTIFFDLLLTTITSKEMQNILRSRRPIFIQREDEREALCDACEPGHASAPRLVTWATLYNTSKTACI